MKHRSARSSDVLGSDGVDTTICEPVWAMSGIVKIPNLPSSSSYATKPWILPFHFVLQDDNWSHQMWDWSDLPTKPSQARNLGYGICLITSAAGDYTLRKTSRNKSVQSQSQIVPGCKICIIAIECGYQLRGHMINIRADFSSCDRIPAKKV